MEEEIYRLSISMRKELYRKIVVEAMKQDRSISKIVSRILTNYFESNKTKDAATNSDAD